MHRGGGQNHINRTEYRTRASDVIDQPIQADSLNTTGYTEEERAADRKRKFRICRDAKGPTFLIEVDATAISGAACSSLTLGLGSNTSDNTLLAYTGGF